ncbi:MAG: hypothetical protein ACJ790_06180 [Myxococcaceae bacterium]
MPTNPNHINGLGSGIDTSKLYVQKRRMDNLIDLAKLSPEDVALLNRADGIIASLPKDGFIETRELTDSRFKNLLLPQEKTHLPSTWDALSWDGKTAPATPSVPAWLGQSVHITTGAATGGLRPSESMAISELPANLQTVAMRIQNVRNGDHKADTISYNDAKHFAATKAQVAGLLPEEASLVPALLEAIAALNVKKHPYLRGEKVEVPALGRQSARLNDATLQGSISVVTDTELTETRSTTTAPSLKLTRSWNVEAKVPAGMTGLLINPQTGEERRVPAGTQNLPGGLAPGDWLFEIWNSTGKRVEASELHMPNMAVKPEEMDLSAHLSASFKSDGKTLYRNLASSNVPTGAASAATFTYGTTQQAQPAGLDLSSLLAARTPATPGIYQSDVTLKGGFSRDGQLLSESVNAKVQIFSDGSVFVDIANLASGLMRPNGNGGYTFDKSQGSLVNAVDLRLDGTSLKIYDNTQGSSSGGALTLNASTRTH